MDGSQKTKDLGSILDGVVQQKSWQYRLSLHQVFLFWDKAMGKDICRHAQPDVIKGDVLWVNVSDSVWMQQLQFEKGTMLEKINRRLGKLEKKKNTQSQDSPAVKLSDIRFHLSPERPEDRSSGEKQEKKPLIAIDPDRLARFENAIGSTVDPEIQESMKRIWLAIEGRGHGQDGD